MRERIKRLDDIQLLYVCNRLKSTFIDRYGLDGRLYFSFRKSEVDFERVRLILLQYSELEKAEQLDVLGDALDAIEQTSWINGAGMLLEKDLITITGFVVLFGVVQVMNGVESPYFDHFFLRRPVDFQRIKRSYREIVLTIQAFQEKRVTAIILTPIKEEYQAVRRQMQPYGPLREVVKDNGSIYLHCRFPGRYQTYDIYLKRTESGLQSTATFASQAIADLQPDVMLLVGNAAGLKNKVKIGDIVIGDRAYEYQSGSVENNEIYYRPRETRSYNESIIERAKIMVDDTAWKKRINYGAHVFPASFKSLAEVILGPIVAGDKTLKDTNSELASFIRKHCGDAIALEKEATGILNAARRDPEIAIANIRAISDMADGKDETDKKGYKVMAANHASAFAFELLYRWKKKTHMTPLYQK